jgi:hypothetical protein
LNFFLIGTPKLIPSTVSTTPSVVGFFGVDVTGVGGDSVEASSFRFFAVGSFGVPSLLRVWM